MEAPTGNISIRGGFGDQFTNCTLRELNKSFLVIQLMTEFGQSKTDKRAKLAQDDGSCEVKPQPLSTRRDVCYGEEL